MIEVEVVVNQPDSRRGVAERPKSGYPFRKLPSLLTSKDRHDGKKQNGTSRVTGFPSSPQVKPKNSCPRCKKSEVLIHKDEFGDIYEYCVCGYRQEIDKEGNKLEPPEGIKEELEGERKRHRFPSHGSIRL